MGKKKEETLTEKLRDLWRKGKHKHTETYLIYFDKHRCLSQSEDRPRGKESTEVRKSQIKGKESENSYQELKRSQNDRHTQTHGNCIEIF